MSEITPNTANPVREDEYYEALAAKLGIPASAIPRTPVWRNEEELAALVQLFTNMQGGSSGGGVLVVRADDDTGALNKTWQEIHDALSNGTIVVVHGPAVQAEFPAVLNYIILADKGEGVYNIYFSYDNESPAMTATSANGYPEWA